VAPHHHSAKFFKALPSTPICHLKFARTHSGISLPTQQSKTPQQRPIPLSFHHIQSNFKSKNQAAELGEAIFDQEVEMTSPEEHSSWCVKI
jgi:hypothetical protein